jgi:hypothetical protein
MKENNGLEANVARLTGKVADLSDLLKREDVEIEGLRVMLWSSMMRDSTEP